MSTRSKVRDAVSKVLTDRGYDNYADDEPTWEETLDDITNSVLSAIWSED